MDKIDAAQGKPPDPQSHASTRNSFLKRNLKSIASIRPFQGILRDIKTRAPYYASDWIDAWNYRVLPATALTFFSNIFPGIAFSLDLIETTHQYGVAEILLSSFMASAVFSIFGAQPLCIAGVTGPITVLNKTIFDVVANHPGGPNYLQFVGWVYMWAAIFHWITAALNWCNLLRYVTLFSCDTFGFFVSWVYLQYGVQVLIRQFNSTSLSSAYVSVILALLMLFLAVVFRVLSVSPLFHRHVRRVFADYGMPVSIVVVSALAYWGRLNESNLETLPVGSAFQAAGGRAWLVQFWKLEARWVGIAFPFGLALWVLFFFDHNVSSLIAQSSNFPLRKPPGFHYDFFLLGLTTFIAGILGIPAPNGLIPQAPIHTRSLVVLERTSRLTSLEEKGTLIQSGTVTPIHGTSSTIQDSHIPPTFEEGYHLASTEVPVAVIEQRVSNLTQGALCLVLLTGPFLRALGLIPRGVLAGLFWYMGLDALSTNGITKKLVYLARDNTLTPSYEPLRRVRKSRIILFTTIELIGFGVTMAIVQTVAAIGFPVIIMLLIPIRVFIIPHMPFSAEEMAILDGPTASPFTMASVGGTI